MLRKAVQQTEAQPHLVEDGIEGFPGGEEGVAGGETPHVEVDGVQLALGVKSENGQLVVRPAVLRRQLLGFQVITSSLAVTGVRRRLLSVSERDDDEDDHERKNTGKARKIIKYSSHSTLRQVYQTYQHGFIVPNDFLAIKIQCSNTSHLELKAKNPWSHGESYHCVNETQSKQHASPPYLAISPRAMRHFCAETKAMRTIRLRPSLRNGVGFSTKSVTEI